MATLDDIIRSETVKRLRCFSGNRVKTAASLDVGIRTLAMWIKRWKEEGLLGKNEDFSMHEYIRANCNVIVDNSPNESVIQKGAIGALNGDGYDFRAIDVEPVDPSGNNQRFRADQLMARHQWNFDPVGKDELGASTPARRSELQRIDLSHLQYRTYAWIEGGRTHVHTINNPCNLYVARGCTTHRVEDEHSVVTILPAPGHFGCVITQRAKEGRPAVAA